ncbi:E3 ubiquitin/ISG15 ligase TRIM25-like [Electrophorus electricus]|uniref:E3 ubiquitin/ISG15 ligase TRIM25-like n=1 Tax=Electrophorus electricus TaxID=8005 RepID=UPI0015D08DDA|nr:E3 ubiquitin/ISG15 ligase TRIM25-like [Electrophorus electricus]
MADLYDLLLFSAESSLECSTDSPDSPHHLPGFLVFRVPSTRTEREMSATVQPAELLAQELSCAICLQLYQDPVSLPCGHSYCLGCMHSVQRSCAPGSPPCCPECRQPFESPEGLPRNFKLSGIVDGFRAAVSGGGLAAKEETVPCQQCLESTVPAAKTCVRCNTPLCQAHLSRHLEQAQSCAHAMTDPVSEPGVSSCPKHRCEVEYVCTHDHVLLCMECLLEGMHQEHGVQTLEAAKSDLRRVVEVLGKSTSDRLQMAEVLLRSARDRSRTLDNTSELLAARATVVLDNMSTHITAYKERMTALVEDELKAYEKAWQSSVATLSEYQQQLSEAQGVAESLLTSPSSDVLFISYYRALEPQLRQAAGAAVPALPAAQQADTRRLRATLATDDFRSEISNLLQCLLSLTNPLELTFNPDTRHPSLMLSTDHQTVRHRGRAKSSLKERAEGFVTATQVLCQQGFTRGSHVWAVELGSGCTWAAGLCYGTIPRKGERSKLGHNAVSWRLQWKNKNLTACHDSVSTTLTEVSVVPPKRLEVALDYDGGTLAFYSIGVKGSKQHLHTFRATFKEAVYPAFGLYSATEESWITLVNGM